MRPLPFLNLLAWVCLAAVPVSVTFGAAPASQYAPDGERFLFVVDMSADMEELQAATEATLFDLIGTGIHGYMKPGDTFGMWTFNKEMTAGKFAMQTWDPRRAKQQATMAAAFVSGLNYEHSSDLKGVTQRLKSVIHSVSNVTVFIMSDGDAPMKGTPFDKTINAEYKRQRKERSSSKRPFVTTLIARDGWIIDQSVTVAGNRINLPPRTLPVAPTPPVQVAIGVTNSVVASPVVQAPPIVIVKPAPKAVIITKPPAETPPPASTPATPPIAETIVAAANPTPAPPTPVTKPAEIATQESILAAANILTMSTPVQATPPKAPTTPPISPAPTSSDTQAVPSSAIENALAKITPQPLAVAARETTVSTEATNSQTPATFQGMGLPTTTSTNPIWMFAFGGILLTSALLLAVAVLRRGRPATGASLITRSMDRR